MDHWKNLYTELATTIAALHADTPIEWVDLWHNQINFLSDEHPFPTPAVFLDFRILSTLNQSGGAQEATVQVGMYVFYETFLDTFEGAYNQEDALKYLDLLTVLQKAFHGSSGTNYAEMSRTGLQPIDTGSAGNLYLLTFSCQVVDTAATPCDEDVTPGDLNVERFDLS